MPSPIRRALSLETALGATSWYGLITVAMTWPLLPGLGRDIPWDLGDSVLNCWILQWGADHAMRFLGGDFSAFRGYFNANIFYPEPLTLAYSEHLTAQVIQILPVYALTGNIVLCHNLLFLSSFVLSGLGMYLLARDLTGSATAGFVAGLFYAFAPFRNGHFSHIQVLSSQWMPFALFAFRRYLQRQRLGALAGACAALVAQNWSCGYFLLYFSPFAAAYVLYEIVERGAWRKARVWVELAAGAVLVIAATVPFLFPYIELRARGFVRRPIAEVVYYSADVYSYLTANGAQRLWGELIRTFPKPEGDAFPAVVPVLLAVIGVGAHAVRVWQSSRADARLQQDASRTHWRKPVVVAASVVMASQLATALIILSCGGFDWQLAGITVRIHNLTRALTLTGLAGVMLLVLSPRARTFARGLPRSAVGFCLAALIAAFLLSLGPVIFSKGVQVSDSGPYGWLYLNVPGYDGLRAPARMAMIVALFLAALGGYGCAVVERRLLRTAPWRAAMPAVARAWWPRLALVAIGLVFLGEATTAPIQLNSTWTTTGLNRPPAHLLTGNSLPRVYRAVQSLSASAALIEFPFGDAQYDMRYMIASALHRRPLVNGYSGGAPESNRVNTSAFSKMFDRPTDAWKVLLGTGATHAIVHEDSYTTGHGPRVSAWLRSHGSRLIGSFGSDYLFELPR